MTQSFIECTNVTQGFKRGTAHLEILSNLNLSIKRGEFVALMGPSGSGKSTLLNLVGGLTKPDAGDVTIEGVNLRTLSEKTLTQWRAANVGFIFQFYHLIPVLSAQANVELPLMLTNLSRRERRERAHTALELVNLSDRASHKPSQLSGGQQQRVAIARALIADPALLVCDEPTGDLDRESADQILQLLHTLNTSFKKTIVMVTHDPRAAEYAGTQWHMDKGVLQIEPKRDIA